MKYYRVLLYDQPREFDCPTRYDRLFSGLVGAVAAVGEGSRCGARAG